VIVGANRIVEHEGHAYHVQCEDLGTESANFEVRVYENGTVLWVKRVPYRAVLIKNLPKLDQDEELRALMEKTIHTVGAAIVKGKLAAS
jgi:hypothetical protein